MYGVFPSRSCQVEVQKCVRLRTSGLFRAALRVARMCSFICEALACASAGAAANLVSELCGKDNEELAAGSVAPR